MRSLSKNFSDSIRVCKTESVLGSLWVGGAVEEALGNWMGITRVRISPSMRGEAMQYWVATLSGLNNTPSPSGNPLGSHRTLCLHCQEIQQIWIGGAVQQLWHWDEGGI